MFSDVRVESRLLSAEISPRLLRLQCKRRELLSKAWAGAIAEGIASRVEDGFGFVIQAFEKSALSAVYGCRSRFRLKPGHLLGLLEAENNKRRLFDLGKLLGPSLRFRQIGTILAQQRPVLIFDKDG